MRKITRTARNGNGQGKVRPDSHGKSEVDSGTGDEKPYQNPLIRGCIWLFVIIGAILICITELV